MKLKEELLSFLFCKRSKTLRVKKKETVSTRISVSLSNGSHDTLMNLIGTSLTFFQSHPDMDPLKPELHDTFVQVKKFSFQILIGMLETLWQFLFISEVSFLAQRTKLTG